LEQKTKAIEQQIQNLGNNSPNPPINPSGNGQQPPINNNKTHRQITVKYNTEEDATEKKGNNFIFDENNDNFQLIPITTAPSPSKNPSNDPQLCRIEEEIRIEYLFDNYEYVRFNNFLIPGDWNNPIRVFISKNNPMLLNIKIEEELVLGLRRSIPSPSNQTPPSAQGIKSKLTLILKCKYLSSMNDNYTFAEDRLVKGNSVFIHKNNPAVINVHLGHEYKVSFELESSKASEFLLDPESSVSIKENDALEVAET
ncbi:1580_t:CDS:2, partial [Racocetra persica]